MAWASSFVGGDNRMDEPGFLDTLPATFHTNPQGPKVGAEDPTALKPMVINGTTCAQIEPSTTLKDKANFPKMDPCHKPPPCFVLT